MRFKKALKAFISMLLVLSIMIPTFLPVYAEEESNLPNIQADSNATSTEISTPTEMPVSTETPTTVETPVPIETPASTETPALTETPVPTEIPAPTETPILTETPMPTEIPIPTETPMPTETQIPTETPTPTISAIPSNIIASATSTTITLTWDAIDSATYELLLDDDINIIDNGTSTTYTHNGLAPNTQHRYKIRAKNIVGYSEWSTEIVKSTAPNIPANILLTASTNSMKVSWDEVDGASGYEIEVGGQINSINIGSSFVHEGLQPNTYYTYRLRAKNAETVGEWSAYITKPTLPGTPKNLTAYPTSTTMTVTWEKEGNVANTYDIIVDGTLITDYTDTTYTQSGLMPNTQHTYIVRIKNESGIGEWSETLTKYTLLTAPVNIHALASSNSIVVVWDALANATAYDIEIDGDVISHSAETMKLHSGLIPNTQHTYRVRGRNAGNVGDWSPYVIQSTSHPNNAVKGEWTTNASMATVRRDHVLIGVNGKVYAIGGLNGNYLNTVEEYDPVTNSWTTKAGMPTQRANSGAVVLNDKIYVIGGQNSSYDYVNTVEEYDPTVNVWTTKANMPTARTNVAVAQINGKIYAIGGNNGSGYLNIVEEYDPETNIWVRKANMPTVRNQMSAAGVNGKIYTIDGYNNSGYLSVVEEYDPATNTWVRKGFMPTARCRQGTTVIDGKIYIVGGYNSTSGFLNIIEEYDPATNSCLNIASMPIARERVGVAYIDGKLYVVGGWNNSYLNTTETFIIEQQTNVPAIPCNVNALATSTSITVVWDAVPQATGYDIEIDGQTVNYTAQTVTVHSGLAPNTQHKYRVRAKNIGGVSDWSSYVEQTTSNPNNAIKGEWTTNAGMDIVRRDHVLAGVNGKVYAIGGLNGNYLNTVEEYGPVTNRWTTKADMPTPRGNSGAVVLNGKIYVIGGQNSSYDYMNTVEEYDPTVNVWTTKANMPTARTNVAVAQINGKIYAIGGNNGSGYLNIVEEYDPETNTWVRKANMPTVRNQMSAAGVNGKIYTIDGYNNSGYLSVVEEYDPATNTWVRKGFMPTARCRQGTTVIDGKIYIVGGYNSTSGFLNIIEEYDPATNSCLNIASMPTARERVGVAYIDGKLYVVGGWNNSYLNTTETFIIEQQTNVPAIPCNVNALATSTSITVVWDAVPQATGYDIEIDGQTVNYTAQTVAVHSGLAPNTQHKYRVRARNVGGVSNWSLELVQNTSNPSTAIKGEWTTNAGMAAVRRDHVLIGVNGKVYAIGGLNGNYLNTVEEYDPVINRWTTKAGMPTQRANSGAVVLNGKIYVIGGQNSSYDYMNTVEEYDPTVNVWTTKANMPTARTNVAVAQINGKIYAIGGNNGSGYLNIVEEYDPETNTWVRKANMPTVRNQMSAAGVNGKIYTIDGYNSSGYLSVVEEYDPVINTWVRKGFMPTARCRHGITVIDGKIYIVGGYNSTSGFLNTIEEYDPATNMCLSISNMPTARERVGVAYINGKLYVVGGWNDSYLNTTETFIIEQQTNTPAIPCNVNALATSTSITVVWDAVPQATGYDVEIDNVLINHSPETMIVQSGLTPNTLHKYRVRARNIGGVSDWSPYIEQSTSNPDNAIKGEWTTNADLKTQRRDHVLAGVNGKVYAIGGYNGSYLNTVEEYDYITNSWTAKADMPTSRANSGAVVLNSKIYVIGGQNSSYDYMNTVEEYDPIVNVWTTKAKMPTARTNVAVAQINGKIYAIGGNNGNGYLNIVEEYDPETNTWVRKANLPTERNQMSLAGVNGKVYAIDGYNSSGYLSVVEEYDPATNTWVRKGFMPTARGRQGTAVINNKIYVIGGNNSSFLNTIEEYDPATNSCLNIASMPTARERVAATYTKGKLYAVGGWNNSYLRKNEAFILAIPENAPDTPTNLSAELTNNSITLKWDAVSGVTGYDVEVDGTNIYSTTNATYTHTGLNPGTPHTYRVRAKNIVMIGNWSTVLTKVTIPNMPTNLNATSIDTTIRVTWDQVAGATGYDIEVDGVIQDNGVSVTYTHGNLTLGTKHTYKVRAKNVGGVTNWTTTITKYTLPTIPTGISITSASNMITIKWDPTAGAEGYDVEVDGVIKDNGLAITYVHSGLTPYSPHTYKIRAKNSAGTGEWSSTINKTAELASPYNVSTVATDNSVTIMWDKITGATGYDIEIDGIILNNGTSTAYVHQGLTANTKHTYKIRAKDSLGTSSFSIPIDVWTLLSVPPNIVVSATSTSIMVTWDAVIGAAGYDIEVDNEQIDNSTNTTYIHSGLLPDTLHTYRIRARNPIVASEWSTKYTKLTAPDVPINITATATNTTISASWNTVVGATEYEVEVDGVIKETVLQPKCLHSGFTPNTRHVYRVRARNSGGASEWNTPIEIITLLDTPSNINLVATTTSIIVTWNAVTGAEGYELERDGVVIDTGIDTTSVCTELNPNTQYTFRVRARNLMVKSDWSMPIKKFTAPTQPTNVTASVTSTSVTATWNAVNGATAYEVEVDGVLKDTVTSPYCTHTGFIPFTAHVYRVRAKNSGGYSEWSAPTTIITLLSTPSGINTVTSGTKITLTWDSVSNATGYDIEVDGTIIDNSSNLTYSHTGLTPNTQHKYRIRAKNATLTSEWSALITKLVASGIPTNINASATSNTITVTWGVIPGATAYDVEVDGVIRENILGTSSTFTGLAPNTQHTYRVRSKNSAGVSDWSATMNISTLLSTPINVVATVEGTKIIVSWDVVPDATAYYIEVDGSTKDNGSSITYTHSGLLPNTQHTYRILAKNATVTSNWAQTITVISAPAIPSNIKTAVTNTSATLTWDAVIGAIGYDIEVDGVLKDTISNTNCTHTGFAPNTQHIYRIRSRGVQGVSEWSTEIAIVTLLSTPANIAATPSENKIVVTWSMVPGATAYEIEIDNSTPIDNGTSLTYTHSGLATNTQHTYRVRAKNATVASNWSVAITQLTVPNVPTITGISSASTFIVLAWSTVAGATGYDISVDGIIKDNGTSTTYVHSGLAPNTNHTYKIRAKNAGATSAWTETISKWTLLNAPTNVSTWATSNSITLAWDIINGATEYDVEVDGVIIPSGSATSYVHTGLTPNTQHTYKVRARNAQVTSDWTTSVTGLTAPTQPINLTANPTDTSIAIGWDSITGATGYEVQVDYGAINNNALSTTYINTLLTPNTKHTYRVRAKNAGGVSDWTTITVTTLLATPSNLTLTATSTAITLVWSGVAGAEGYDVEADGVVIYNGLNTSFIHGGLLPSTQHTYKVRAKNTEGVSGWSAAATKSTALIVPTRITIPSLTSNSVIITWDAIAGATKYEIEADGTVIDNGLSTTYVHRGLTANTQHTYRVRAKNAAGTGDWSVSTTVTTSLDLPTNITATVTDTSIAVSWGIVAGATGYDIEVDKVVKDNGTSTTFVHSGLTPNTQHTYRIRAKYAGGVSDWSNEISKFTAPTIPTNIVAVAIGNNITVTWNQVAGATGYDIEVDGNPLYNGTGTSYIHNGLQSGTKHTYRVRAKNAGGDSLWSEAVSKWVLPSTPTNVTAVATDTTITLTWDAVAGATEYDVELDGSSVYTTTALAYVHGGLLPGTQHTYRVRAKNVSGAGEWGQTITKFTAPAIPVNITATSTSIAITVAWTAVMGATGYDIEADGTIIDVGFATSYVHTGLASSTQHSYRVRAKNAAGISNWSATTNKSTLFGAPIDIIAKATSSAITVTWSAVTGATGYDIEVDGIVVDNSSNTSFIHGGVASNTQHTYRVRAKSIEGISNWSASITKVTALGTPTNVTATATSTEITVKWNAVAGVMGYDIEVDGVIKDNGLGTAYTHTGLIPNTQHTYRVRTKNAEGASDWSTLITVSTLLGIPTNAIAISSGTEITITWNAVSGATGYDIEVDGEVIEDNPETSFVHGGLIPNSEHTYSVRARNVECVSEWSSLITKYTAPAVPENLATVVTDSMITVTWDAVVGATGYYVEVDGNSVYNGTSTTYVHSGLTTGTLHTYRVKARNDDGISNWSMLISKWTLPGTPVSVVATASSNSITITWIAVTGATGYDIKVDGEEIDNGTKTTYIHTGLMPNTQHTYSVRARNAVGTGNWSTPISKYTLPPAPSNITVTTTDTTATVTWGAVTGATGYYIEVDGSSIYNGSSTTYTHRSLTPGTRHTYRVKSRTSVVGDWSAPISVVTLPAIPTNITAFVTDTAVTVSWDAATGATSYEVEVDGAVSSVTNTAYTHSSLIQGSQHTYRVRAKNEGGVSGWSGAITKTTLPSVPTNITAQITSNTITVTWNAVTSATGYDITVDGQVINNGTSTTYVHSGLTYNTEHTYKVRAKNVAGAGNWSALVSYITKDPVVEITREVEQLESAATDLTTQAKIDAAQATLNHIQTEVNGLHNPADQQALQQRLNAVQAKINEAQKVLNAQNAVVSIEVLVNDLTTQVSITTAQQNLNAAIELLHTLPAGAERDALEQRITVVQTTINVAQTTVYVQDVETTVNNFGDSVTQVEVDDAQRRLNELRASVNVTVDVGIRTGLLTRLDAVQGKIDTVQVTINVAVITVKIGELETVAGNLPTQTVIDNAQQLLDDIQKLINALPQGDQRRGQLQIRLDVVQVTINIAVITLKLQTLEAAANNLTTQAAIDSARQLQQEIQQLINALNDARRAQLQTRLNAVIITIDVAQVTIKVQELEGLVANLTTQAQMDNAQQFLLTVALQVDALPNSDAKAALFTRVDAAQLKIDIARATLAVQESETKVLDLTTAEKVESAQQSLDGAKELVNILPDGADKVDLLKRLDVAQEKINAARVGTGTGLTAQYYNTKDFTELKMVKTDEEVNFDWGSGSPNPIIGADSFSIRWAGQVQPKYTQKYTFYAQSDDGVRIWVDNKLIVDSWVNQSTTEHSGTIDLVAGKKYDIKMEYYEYNGSATTKLLWSSSSQIKQVIPQTQLYSTSVSGTGLNCEYYANKDLTNLKIVRTDAAVNFDWGSGSPDASIGADGFSARWTGQIQPIYTQKYRFYTQANDGVRLWVDNRLIIDKWINNGTMTEYYYDMDLVAGQKYDIVMEYYKNSGSAIAKLLWSSQSQAKEVVSQGQLYPSYLRGTGLKVEYFDNKDLTGLKVSRTDATVNFNWGSGSPDATVGTDTFSARWTGQVQPLYSQSYTFYTQADDGVRLWVDNKLLIDSWTDTTGTIERSGTIALAAGKKYDIKVEYYENTGNAVAKLLWSSASQTKEVIPQSQLFPTVISGTGLKGEYYDNKDLTSLKLTRTDATVDFVWGSSSPDETIGVDTFSARWTGQVQSLYSQTYTFYTQASDGIRLWVNNQLVIDEWGDHTSITTERSGTINLTAGQKYDIKLEYFENGGEAAVKLLWSSANQAKEVVPQSQLFN